MDYRVCVSAVVHKDGKILLGQKAPGVGPYPDTWHIPGGGVDLGDETTDDAVIREVREETGLEIKNIQRVFWTTDTTPNKHGKDVYYIFLIHSADYASGELQAGDDMHHFEWVDIKDLGNYNINEPTKELFKKLGYF